MFIKVIGVGVLALGFLLLTVGSGTPRVLAEKAGVEISPLVIEFQMKAGEEKEAAVKLKNPTSVPQAVNLKVLDFEPLGESGELKFIEETDEDWSLSAWIKIKEESFLLNAGGEKEVVFTIKAPITASEGGYAASLLALGEARPVLRPVLAEGQGTGLDSGQGGTVHQAGVGTIVLVRVLGEGGVVREEARIESLDIPGSFKIGPGFVVLGDLIPVWVRVANLGTVFLKVSGDLEWRDWQGKVVGSHPLTSPKIVFPSRLRRFETQTERAGFFGPLTLTARLSYGEGQPRTVERSVRVLLLPLETVPIALFALLSFSIGLLGFWVVRRIDKFLRKV